MNYIYDIVLNFNRDSLYDFYEWKEEDCPEFIIKIPVFKIEKSIFLDFKNNNIILPKDFILSLQDKTEVYNSNSIKIIKYACLFACDDDVIAIEFDSEGNNYMKSLLSMDEQNDVLEVVKMFKYSLVDYKIKNKISNNKKFLTRNELDMERIIEKKINNIYIMKDYSKLKYIFYEIFNEKMDDETKIYQKLINIIKNNDNKLKRIKEILLIMENSKIIN